MSAPTPGPFGSQKCGCTISKLGQFIDIERCDLHQSAPDLIAACEALTAALRHVTDAHVPNIEHGKALARAAIAKARGGK